MAQKRLEEALELMEAGQPLRLVCLYYLWIIATEEGHLEEAYARGLM
jgi:hypothetical protein